MSTESDQLRVAGLAIQVIRKDIKNLHLGVYPPDGRVRLAVPFGISDAAARLAIIGKVAWIRRQQARFAAQPRQSKREMVSGESHFYMGRRYRLHVVEREAPSRVLLRRRAILELQVRGRCDAGVRRRVLFRWYRERLRELLPPVLARWEVALGVRALDVRIRRMRTRWGTCNALARRIWVNLDLALKPVQCLDYIIVHELAHFIEPLHGERFVALMDRHLPRWRHHRDVLNQAPLGHAEWTY